MKLPHATAAIASAAIATLVSLAAPVQAQTYDPKYPVCLQIYESMVNYYFECAYTSMPQCQASASGRYASCVVNPYFTGKMRASTRKKRPRTR